MNFNATIAVCNPRLSPDFGAPRAGGNFDPRTGKAIISDSLKSAYSPPELERQAKTNGAQDTFEGGKYAVDQVATPYQGEVKREPRKTETPSEDTPPPDERRRRPRGFLGL